MKKELKEILLILVFVFIGCAVGYAVAETQANQLHDPEYIAFWTKNHMPVPEPISFRRSITGFALLFSGIPTGLIFFNRATAKWLTASAPKILIGFLTFPLYTMIGVLGSIPFMIYSAFVLIKNIGK